MAWQNRPLKKAYGGVHHCEILKALQIVGKASKQCSGTLNLDNCVLGTRDQSHGSIFYVTISSILSVADTEIIIPYRSVFDLSSGSIICYE